MHSEGALLSFSFTQLLSESKFAPFMVLTEHFSPRSERETCRKFLSPRRRRWEGTSLGMGPFPISVIVVVVVALLQEVSAGGPGGRHFFQPI